MSIDRDKYVLINSLSKSKSKSADSCCAILGPAVVDLDKRVAALETEVSQILPSVQEFASQAAASAAAAGSAATAAGESAAEAISAASTAGAAATSAAADAITASNAADAAVAAATATLAAALRFLLPSATVPTTRDDASALQDGDIYLNTSNNVTYTFDSGAWVAMGDEVQPHANAAAFPAVGVRGVLYIDEAANATFRWDPGTSAYVQLGGSTAIAAQTVLGNNTGSPAAPIAMSVAQTLALILPKYSFSFNNAGLNSTVTVVAVSNADAATNSDLALVPKGTGSLQAQIPDGTSAGGNKRGQYAVDWQLFRGDAAFVASANYSTISGGRSNKATYMHSTVGGGDSNTASGDASTVSGGSANTASGGTAAIGGGVANSATALYTTVGGGISNTASNESCTVGGGFGNNASGYAATVAGGFFCDATSAYSCSIGGYQGDARGSGSSALGGYSATTYGLYSATVAGNGNLINGSYSVVLAGANQTANHTSTVVLPSLNTFATPHGDCLARRFGSASGKYSYATLYWMGADTTNATPTKLALDTAVTEIPIAGKTNQKGLNLFKLRVTGTDGTDYFAKESSFAIKSDGGAGSSSLLAAETVILSDASAGAATWTVVPGIYTTGGYDHAIFTVTGEAGKNISWRAEIEQISTQS